MRVLVSVEMVGTLKALEKPLELLLKDGSVNEVRYAAAAAAAKHLTASDVPYFTLDNDPSATVETMNPHFVIVGAAAGVATPSGIETSIGLAAMQRGIPVICYRDYSGINDAVAGPLAAHPRAKELLHFFMFDEATVKAVRDRGYPCAKAIAVGSAAYDGDSTRDWDALRASARQALGLDSCSTLITFIGGGEKTRVLEALVPTVAGFAKMMEGNPLYRFAPFFHPKDPDASYMPDPEKKGSYLARPSIYDEVLSPLGDRMFPEPFVRNLVPDSKARVAASDLIVMNPLSTDNWTAIYAGTPFVCSALPLMVAEGAKDGIDVFDLDFVTADATDVMRTPEELEEYIAMFPRRQTETRNRLRRRMQDMVPKEDAGLRILCEILNVAETQIV